MRFSDGLVVCDLEHRCRVAALCMFNKIRCNPDHALEAALPGVRVPERLTSLVAFVHFVLVLAQVNVVSGLFLV